MSIGRDIVYKELVTLSQSGHYDKLLLLVDQTVAHYHGTEYKKWCSLLDNGCVKNIIGGEQVKSIEHLGELWSWMHSSGCTRSSLLIMIGGGSLTDLGGLAAATYMRGIDYISCPTTLLGMVDAAHGGKTAIDLGGVKNLVGSFHTPKTVVVDLSFLDTLPLCELYSGFAEIIKYGILSGGELWHTILKTDDPQCFTEEEWIYLITESIAYKQSIVEQDYKESSIRRRLNLGHTVAHSLEAYSHRHKTKAPLLHGEAVAIGLIIETYIAVQYYGGSRDLLRQLVYLCRELYSPFVYTCREYPQFLELMHSDKKNTRGNIYLELALAPGQIESIVLTDEEAIKAGLDFYRETFAG